MILQESGSDDCSQLLVSAMAAETAEDMVSRAWPGDGGCTKQPEEADETHAEMGSW